MRNPTALIVLSCSADVSAAVLGEGLLVAYGAGRRVFLLSQMVVQEYVEYGVLSISVI
jgi:hypothetical protein